MSIFRRHNTGAAQTPRTRQRRHKLPDEILHWPASADALIQTTQLTQTIKQWQGERRPGDPVDHAQRELVRIGTPAAGMLVAQIYDAVDEGLDASVVCNLIDPLGKIAAQQAIAALAPFAKHDDPAIRDAVAQALGEFVIRTNASIPVTCGKCGHKHVVKITKGRAQGGTFVTCPQCNSGGAYDEYGQAFSPAQYAADELIRKYGHLQRLAARRQPNGYPVRRGQRRWG